MKQNILVLILLLQGCVSYASNVVQQDRLKAAKAGDSIHLSCKGSEEGKTTIAWIKKKFDEKPLVIATSYQYQPGIFHNDFAKSGRFKTQTAAGSFNLSISNLVPSDTATYYCAITFLYEITFEEGTLLIVERATSKKTIVYQQPVSKAVQPGDAATLQCSVLTDTSTEEHSVYWFRHGSGESQPGIIYSHGNRSDQCEKSSKTGSPTHSCVYKLTKRNLSLSDAGTYYCAVAICGVILFGNGTELNITDSNPPSMTSTFCFISIYSNIILLLILILTVIMWCLSAVIQKAAHDEMLNIDALSFTKKPPSSRYRRTPQNYEETTVYSRVIYHEQR